MAKARTLKISPGSTFLRQCLQAPVQSATGNELLVFLALRYADKQTRKNYIAGPGEGKSTLAMLYEYGVFRLKWHGSLM